MNGGIAKASHRILRAARELNSLRSSTGQGSVFQKGSTDVFFF